MAGSDTGLTFSCFQRSNRRHIVLAHSIWLKTIALAGKKMFDPNNVILPITDTYHLCLSPTLHIIFCLLLEQKIGPRPRLIMIPVCEFGHLACCIIFSNESQGANERCFKIE